MSKASSLIVAPERNMLPNSILEFYLDYWDQKRCGRAMPSRADIRPSQLKPYLGYLILADSMPGLNDFRYRLIGTRVTEYFLRDATGSTIREAYGKAGMPGSYIESVVQTHRAVCEARTTLLVSAPYGEWRGQVYPEFDVLYFPLSDDGENVNMIMEAFTFDDHRLRTLRSATRTERVAV